MWRKSKILMFHVVTAKMRGMHVDRDKRNMQIEE